MPHKLSPHKNYSNYKPSVLNLFPSIGHLDNQGVYMSTTQEKQYRFHNSLDFEVDELPGIAKKVHHVRGSDIGKYKHEHL